MLIHGTLTDTHILGQSGFESIGNEVTLHSSQIFRSGVLLSDAV